MLSSPNRGEEREGIEDSRPGPLRAGRWLFPHVLFPERSKATILSQCKMRKLKSEEGPANSPRSQSSSEHAHSSHLRLLSWLPSKDASTSLYPCTGRTWASYAPLHARCPEGLGNPKRPCSRAGDKSRNLCATLGLRDSFHLTVTWPRERGY